MFSFVFLFLYFVFVHLFSFLFSLLFALENGRNAINPTVISTASPSEFFHSTIANAQFFIMNSVQPNSRGTYCSGWKHWNDWSAKFQTNNTMTLVPDYYVADSYMSFHVTCIVSFLAYLSLFLHLSPRTCNNYVSAVRYFLINANVDVSFLDNNQTIRATRTGMANHHVATHPVAEDHTLPLSCDMLIHGINFVHNTGHPQDDCINAAMLTARCRLLRVSEILKVASEDHFLRARDIEFEFSHGDELSFVSSNLVSESMRSHLSGVSLYTRSRKNDISGKGQKSYFSFDCVRSQCFNLPITLFNWAIRAQLNPDDHLFSYRQCWRLTYHIFNEAHKKVARSLGIDPTHFSTHSSRIGGACSLAAAGFPDSFIMLYGGWSSLAFLFYVRLATTQYNSGLKALSDRSIVIMMDVRRLIPGFTKHVNTLTPQRDSLRHK